MPDNHTEPSTPHQILAGVRARWDKLRLFGCGALHLIPNDPLAKVPGIVKRKKTVLVGFTGGCNGYRVFDPETRRYSAVGNVYFFEGFKHRIDALRQHDQRQALMKAGKAQSAQVDDWEDPDAQVVRNLFTYPDVSQVDFRNTGNAERRRGSSNEAT